MASSHSGEDFHVRTIQGMFRRAGVSQNSSLAARGDAARSVDRRPSGPRRRKAERDPPHVLRTARGLAAVVATQGLGPRDLLAAGTSFAGRLPVGGRPGVRHDPGPARDRDRRVRRRDIRVPPPRSRPAYAILADPGSLPRRDPRSSIASAVAIVRDAMLANPEMIAGRHDRLDTSLMKAVEGRLISKAGMEALRAIAILPGPAQRLDCRGRPAGGQDRGRRRLRPRDVGGVGRGAPAGRRARRRGATGAGALPPADDPRPAWPGRREIDPRVRARAGR